MSGSGEWLEKKLTEYKRSDIYPFHMPGHKRQCIFSDESRPAERKDRAGFREAGSETDSPEILRAAAGIDITEIDGFDDLHAPSGILKEEMNRAAALYGADHTFFSVNGSTGAILAAISAAVPEGGRILAARNCHRSVFHAIYLRRLEAYYVLPAAEGTKQDAETVKNEASARDASWALAGGEVRPEDVADALREHPGTAAVVITSPTYDGIVSDICGIARAAHEGGALLIVDEAHGAHFSMHPYFPESAVRLGADLVIQSMHKTLPALTQTALLHVCGKYGMVQRLQYYMDIYETSSPSYLLMASMTSCIHALEERGEALFAAYAERLASYRERLTHLQTLELLTYGSEPGCMAAAAEITGYEEKRPRQKYDPSKICIGVGTSGLTGPELARILRVKWHIETEMCAPDYVLAMTSVGDTEEGFERLYRALSEIDRRKRTAANGRRGNALFGALYGRQLPVVRKTISEAMEEALFAEYQPEERKASGFCETDGLEKVSRCFVDCYPPGIPLIVPGEVIPEDLVERIRTLKEKGLFIAVRPESGFQIPE